MASPFAPYKNATLRFAVASGQLVADRNGNMRPASSVVEVEALLEQKRDPRREPKPGVDPSAIWVEGYLVEPRPMPGIVTPDSPAQITWQGRAGRFYMEFTARNPYLVALNIDLVERIRGYFLPGSFVVTGDDLEESMNSARQYSDAYPAATALSALRVVMLTSGALVYADSLNPAHAFSVLGILPNSVGAGESIRVLTDGTITDPSWSFQPDKPVWLGALGQLTQTAPESGFLLQVATAITSNTLDFEIQEVILL